MKLRSKEEKIVQIISHTVMIILSVLSLIPFWLLLSASVTEEGYAVKYGYQFIPEKFSSEAFAYIMQQWDQIGRAYGITILVTVIGTFFSVLFVAMLAYGLCQKDIPGVRVVFILVLFTMLFSGGIVPTYYVYNNLLHIKNTIFALLIPGLLMNGFTVILVRNYLQHNIPAELTEAAEVDGAGQFHIFFKLIIPLSTPILATVGLLNAVAYWNDWTNGLYYISNENLYSIQLLLNRMNDNILFLANNASILAGVDLSNFPSATIRMAIAVVAILPIICIYPFFQKYFAKGITMGAVKG